MLIRARQERILLVEGESGAFGRYIRPWGDCTRGDLEGQPERCVDPLVRVTYVGAVVHVMVQCTRESEKWRKKFQRVLSRMINRFQHALSLIVC